MRQLDRFIEQAALARDGKLDSQAEQQLSNDIYFAYYGKRETGFIARAMNRGWSEACAALGVYADSLDQRLAEAQAQAASLSATAIASAAANAYSDAVAGVESLDTLSKEDKAELEKLLLDVKTAKEKDMLEHATKTLVEKAIEKGVDTFPYVFPVIAEAARGLLGI